MKKLTTFALIAIGAVILMSFYSTSTNKQYAYMTIHVPVSISKPSVFISRAGLPMKVIEYKKEDFDMSTELARIETYEKEGWELFSVVNQNSLEMNVLFILRKEKP